MTGEERVARARAEVETLFAKVGEEAKSRGLTPGGEVARLRDATRAIRVYAPDFTHTLLLNWTNEHQSSLKGASLAVRVFKGRLPQEGQGVLPPPMEIERLAIDYGFDPDLCSWTNDGRPSVATKELVQSLLDRLMIAVRTE
jgi:hypothetical protein